MKGNRMAKRSSFGSISSFGTIARKRLSDVTNLLPQPKSPIHDEKLPKVAFSAKEYTDQLLKENMALVEVIADKNKIIELRGAELQKMRINLQKMQLQNWNLAQSNSHMLAELNLGKDKLKELRHELMCKEALLKVKKSVLEEKAQMNNQKTCSQMNNQKTCSQEGEGILGENRSDDKNIPCDGPRRQIRRSQSLGASTFQQVVDKETAENKNKRRSLRRQSAGFKSHQQAPVQNFFEIEDAQFPFDLLLDGQITLCSSIKKQKKDGESSPSFDAHGSQRTSIGGRPLRKAVEKIQSYKEVPLNTKMRRQE